VPEEGGARAAEEAAAAGAAPGGGTTAAPGNRADSSDAGAGSKDSGREAGAALQDSGKGYAEAHAADTRGRSDRPEQEGAGQGEGGGAAAEEPARGPGSHARTLPHSSEASAPGAAGAGEAPGGSSAAGAGGVAAAAAGEGAARAVGERAAGESPRASAAPAPIPPPPEIGWRRATPWEGNGYSVNGSDGVSTPHGGAPADPARAESQTSDRETLFSPFAGGDACTGHGSRPERASPGAPGAPAAAQQRGYSGRDLHIFRAGPAGFEREGPPPRGVPLEGPNAPKAGPWSEAHWLSGQPRGGAGPGGQGGAGGAAEDAASPASLGGGAGASGEGDAGGRRGVPRLEGDCPSRGAGAGAGAGAADGRRPPPAFGADGGAARRGADARARAHAASPGKALRGLCGVDPGGGFLGEVAAPPPAPAPPESGGSAPGLRAANKLLAPPTRSLPPRILQPCLPGEACAGAEAARADGRPLISEISCQMNCLNSFQSPQVGALLFGAPPAKVSQPGSPRRHKLPRATSCRAPPQVAARRALLPPAGPAVRDGPASAVLTRVRGCRRGRTWR